MKRRPTAFVFERDRGAWPFNGPAAQRRENALYSGPLKVAVRLIQNAVPMIAPSEAGSKLYAPLVAATKSTLSLIGERQYSPNFISVESNNHAGPVKRGHPLVDVTGTSWLLR